MCIRQSPRLKDGISSFLSKTTEFVRYTCESKSKPFCFAKGVFVDISRFLLGEGAWYGSCNYIRTAELHYSDKDKRGVKIAVIFLNIFQVKKQKGGEMNEKLRTGVWVFSSDKACL